jgi:thymidylate synthase
MVTQWSNHQLEGITIFVDAIEAFTNGSPLLIKFNQNKIDKNLSKKHRRVFPWHYADTKRSYTQEKLRMHGSRGKTEDFAYRNRLINYFGYNQMEAQLEKPNKIICMWNAGFSYKDSYQSQITHKGDMFGEHNPCLTTMRFIPRGKVLDLVVTFRKRDLLRRFIPNIVMLGQWLDEACKEVNKNPGNIIDFSMEAFYREEDLDKWRRTI